MSRDSAEIPYPPVFRDWRPDLDIRVGVAVGACGVGVEMNMEPMRDGAVPWRRAELTERDACLLAASLLQRSGQKKLAGRVLKKLGPGSSKVKS